VRRKPANERALPFLVLLFVTSCPRLVRQRGLFYASEHAKCSPPRARPAQPQIQEIESYGLSMQETAPAATTATAAPMKINPCERDDSRVGRALALLTEGTDCRCCIGARIVLALLTGLAAGAVLARAL
jgi:hypothetical protein